MGPEPCSSTNTEKEAIGAEEESGSWTRARARERAWEEGRVSGVGGHEAGEHSPAAEMMT